MSDSLSWCCCDVSLWREIYHVNEIGGLNVSASENPTHPNIVSIREQLNSMIVAVSSEGSFSPIESFDASKFSVDCEPLMDSLVSDWVPAGNDAGEDDGGSFRIAFSHTEGDEAIGLATLATDSGFGIFPTMVWVCRWNSSATGSTTLEVDEYIPKYTSTSPYTMTLGGNDYEVFDDTSGINVFWDNIELAFPASRYAIPYAMTNNTRIETAGVDPKVYGASGSEVWGQPNYEFYHGGLAAPLYRNYDTGGVFGDPSFPSTPTVGDLDGAIYIPMLVPDDPTGHTHKFDGYEWYKVIDKGGSEGLSLVDRWPLDGERYVIAGATNRVPLAVAVKSESFTSSGSQPGQIDITTNLTFSFGRANPGLHMLDAKVVHEVDSYTVVQEDIPSGQDSAEELISDNVSRPTGFECFVIAGTGQIKSVDEDHGVAVFYKGNSDSSDQDWHCWLDGTEVSTFITRDLEKGHDNLYERAPTLAAIQAVNSNPPAAKVRTNDSTRLNYEYRELWHDPPGFAPPVLVSNELIEEGRWYTAECHHMAFFNRLPANDNEANFAVLFTEQKDSRRWYYTTGGTDHIFAKTLNGENIGGTLESSHLISYFRTRLELYNRNGELLKILRGEDNEEMARVPADAELGDHAPPPRGRTFDVNTGGLYGYITQGYGSLDRFSGSIHGASDNFIYCSVNALEGTTPNTLERSTVSPTVQGYKDYAVNYLGEYHETTRTHHDGEPVAFDIYDQQQPMVFQGTACFPNSNISEPMPLDAKDKL